MIFTQPTPIPLLMPMLFTVLGIVSAPLATEAWPLWLAFVASIVLSWWVDAKPILQNIGLLLCFFCLGMLLGHRADEKAVLESPFEAVVASEPVEKPKTIAVDLMVPEHNHSVRCYIWKDERSRKLMVGHALQIWDMKDGLVRAGAWQRGGRAWERLSAMSRVRLWCLWQRHQLLSHYQPYRMNEEDYAVMVAMTLGDKSALSKDVRDTYARTGASHVLALSGLHLGIIYMLLYQLLFGLRRFWLSHVIIIMSVWAYAFLTGLSTSVVRASVMITVYALAAVGSRQRAPVNLLCFTALIMLLINPHALYEVGFQLSFMAVFSILLFMPLLEGFFPENYLNHRPMLRRVVSVFGVSLAAQLGVAPLIAYHFGYFSTYFLLTNIIVLPLTIVTLYGMLVVVVYPPFCQILMGVVNIQNKALGWVAQMPCSTIDGLHPSISQVVILYLIYLCLFLAARRIVRKVPIT